MASRRPFPRDIVLARISPEQLADILDIAEDGIVTVDARQQIVLFNRGAAQIFGYTPEEAVGRPLELLLPDRFRPAHAGQVEEFGRSPAHARLMGERREVFGRRKDGTEFPAEVSISRFGTGDGMLFTAIVRDVSERKRYEAAERELEQLRATARLAQAEAEARESESRFRTLADSAPVLIWVNGPTGCEFVNQQYLDFVGMSLEEVRGMKWADRLHPDDAAGYLESYRRAEAERASFEATFRFRRADGEYRWFKSIGRPRFAADRTYCGYVGCSIDITDLREADRRREEVLVTLQARTEELRGTTQQLWQAARLAGVGELAASIAHELNNPLATVSLRIEGILAKTPAADPRRNPLEVVEQEVERMASLVSNLLQFSRAGRDQVSTVDVCDEITKTVELITHHLRKRQIRVEPDFAPGVGPIHADRQQLRQVLLNLFTNAADAMPGGGSLTPRVRAGELPDGIPAVVVEVSDSGEGIPADLLARVFDPFFTTKEDGKGTGLGLAICKRIVEQHHGRLGIDSEVGRGTTVRVTLPVRPDTNVASLRTG